MTSAVRFPLFSSEVLRRLALPALDSCLALHLVAPVCCLLKALVCLSLFFCAPAHAPLILAAGGRHAIPAACCENPVSQPPVQFALTMWRSVVVVHADLPPLPVRLAPPSSVLGLGHAAVGVSGSGLN